MKNLFVAGCVSIVMTGCTTNELLTEQQEANPTQTAQSKDATLRTPEEALEIANEMLWNRIPIPLLKLSPGDTILNVTFVILG